MWAGLWQAPSLEQIAADLPAVRHELTEQLRQSLGLRTTPAAGPVFEHATSHRSVVFVTFSSSATPRTPGPDRQWVPRERLHEFGMSNAHRKVIDLALNH
jgi:adenine-specific DNA glycosylase